jgi:Glyoxalase/Bleomycin resistance protein/Dioxygenase superfamily
VLSLAPHHLGIVVAELAPAMDAWHRNVGVSFSVFEVNETNSQFSGSSAAFSLQIAFGLTGVAAIELIQPVGGETLYSRYLKEQGAGPHHVGFLAAELAASGRRLESEGCVRILEGRIDELGSFNYYRMQDGNCIIEPLQLSVELPMFLASHAKTYPQG